jgi:anti-sigma factor RsiW
MNALLEDVGWRACTSAYRLDRWRLGELPGEEAAEVQSHLDGCARCRQAVESLVAAEADFRAAATPLRLVSPAPPRRARWLVPAATLALAAGAVLALRPEGGLRTKGPAVSVGMHVQHAGEVHRAGPREVLAPGDTVRFTYSTSEAGYLAILSVDGAGVASVYYPEGPETVPVEAAQDAALPLGTRLDGVLGEERVVGLFCTQPRTLEPVRQALQAAAPGLPEVPGCRLATFGFTKR